MEQIDDVTQSAWDQIRTLFNMEIYNGKSFADLLTFEALIGLTANALAALAIVALGFAVSGVLRRSIRKIAENHSSLDNTLFRFLGNITRYTILAFTVLFVLNTFGIQTTSIIAVLGAAKKVIREAVMSDPRSMADPEPFLQVNNLGDSSVDFLMRVWCKSGDYFQYQADMKRKVKEALDAAEIDIPFPTRTVHVQSADAENDAETRHAVAAE